LTAPEGCLKRLCTIFPRSSQNVGAINNLDGAAILMVEPIGRSLLAEPGSCLAKGIIMRLLQSVAAFEGDHSIASVHGLAVRNIKERLAMTRKIAGTAFVLLGLLLAVSTTRLWSQGQAGTQISGLVSDTSGAVVPNATVRATQTNTGLVRTTVSGPNGNYVLPDLPVGPYKLEVQSTGFNAYVQESFFRLTAALPLTSR